MVGLFFFIRASAKDRTEQVKLLCEQAQDAFLPQIQEYFDQRSYRIKAIDAQKNQVTFQGLVQPSWFLAIFLTLLAGCGWLCLALVLAFVFPAVGNIFVALTFFAPLAGVFYWFRARRIEEVSLQWQTDTEQVTTPHSIITVTAHRDELIQLQQALPVKPIT